MRHVAPLTLLSTLFFVTPAVAQTDIMADTWVATDALGRTTPTASQCPQKTDKPRTVGIFYITWHDEGKYGLPGPYHGDVTRVLKADPQARFEIDNKEWSVASLHWGEPEMGYFLSQDEYVIRRDLSMLSDAGVDVLILDVTNAVLYWDEWKVLFATMKQMRDEGNRVPQFCFWAFNGNVVSVVEQLYERIYQKGEYSDFWFMWQGKPLLLYNATPNLDANGSGYATNDYSEGVKNFFTLRNFWWGYAEWGGRPYVGTEDNWCFGYELNDPRVAAKSPQERASTHEGRVEQMAVTPAQHAISTTGKSWRVATGEPKLNQYDLPDSAYVPWLGKTVAHPEGYGIYFQDRWDEALSVDPDFVYLNDWNEWTAGKYQSGKAPGSEAPGPTEFLGRKNSFYFVDQYNSEFNRCIQPMRGGYADNYYMQMVENIRRYKGVRPIPQNVGLKTIAIDGRFDDWTSDLAAYRDTRGDVAHRDHNGYGALHYTDSTGRNDIVLSRVAMTKRDVCFYVETADALSPATDDGWMLLFVDTDCSATTGWEGYDLMVSHEGCPEGEMRVLRYDSATSQWNPIATARYAAQGNKIELAVPRSVFGAKGKQATFQFKWADNPQNLDSIISLCTYGDTAPNRRFAYRYEWRAK